MKNTNGPISSAPDFVHNLDERDIYVIDGEQCRLTDSSDSYHVFRPTDAERDRSRDRVVERREFAKNLHESSIVIHKPRLAAWRSKLQRLARQPDLRQLSESEQERVLFYFGLCKYYDRELVEYEAGRGARKVNLGKSCLDWLLKEAKSEIVETYNPVAIGGRTKRFEGIGLPTPRHFARLYRRYVEDERTVAAFIHRYRGSNTRSRRGNPDEWSIRSKHQMGFACSERPSKAHQYRRYTEAVRTENRGRIEKGLPSLMPVCRKSFEKGIDQIDKFHVCAEREGEKAALSKFGSSGTGFDYLYPLQRVELDEWKMDVIAILSDLRVWQTLSDEEQDAIRRVNGTGRLWSTVAIDVATRCVLALKIHVCPPNTDTALETLEMALTDKSAISSFVSASNSWDFCGWIETVVMDNAAQLVSQAVEVPLHLLGIEIAHPKAGDPRARPHIERAFKTFSQTFLNEYSGRTFSDVVERGQYDPGAEATLCADTLARNVLRQAIDIYHNSPHENLGGETPRNAWMRMTREHPVGSPPDSHLLRKAFGLEMERKVSKEGIRFLGLQFNSEHLQRTLHGTSVLFRISRQDVSVISVWDKAGQEWFDVRATLETPSDISIYEWTTIGLQHMEMHAQNAELSLDVIVDAANDVRRTTEIAELRAGINPQQNRRADRALLDKLDRERFARLRVVEGRRELAPLVDITGRRDEHQQHYERPLLWDEGSERPTEDRYRVGVDDDTPEPEVEIYHDRASYDDAGAENEIGIE